MITIENAEVFGWEAAIRGMRNPKKSTKKSKWKIVPSKEDIEDKDDMGSNKE